VEVQPHSDNHYNTFKIQILCSHVPHDTILVDDGPHMTVVRIFGNSR